MTNEQKKYYCRFAQFAIDCAKLVSKLDWRIPSNKEWGRQLIRSAGSPGANYIEAIEGTTNSEFIYKFGLSRRESSESVHWLFLLKKTNSNVEQEEFNRLMKEGLEFVKIFTSSIETKKKKLKSKMNAEC